MGQLEDMRVDGDASPDATDFHARRESATADFGVEQVGSAEALGAEKTVGSDFRAAANAVKTFAAGSSAAREAAHILRSVDEEGRRAPAVGKALAEEAKQGIASWVERRPEAAWQFVKREMQTAWEPVDDESAAGEGYQDITEGARTGAKAPAALERMRAETHGRAVGRLAQMNNKAVRQQKKADKIAGTVGGGESLDAAVGGISGGPPASPHMDTSPRKASSATKGERSAERGGTALAKFRQRYHQSKASRLKGEGQGVAGRIVKARRAKSEAVANISRRGFLIAAGAGVVAIPLVLGSAVSCSAGALAGIAGGLAGNSRNGSLTAVESQVAAFFIGKGLDSLHAAAIMGNIYAESRMNPSLVESNGVGIGLCQWSYARADGLRSYAASKGAEWTDLATQLEFFWDHDIWAGEWWSSYRTSEQRYGDPPAGTLVSGSKGGFLSAGDLGAAIEEFCFGWERPSVPRLGERKDAAQRYLVALASQPVTGSGGGQALSDATAAQRAVVDAARGTPSPGANYCAMWVSMVFRNAGYGYPGGNANDMYAKWCTSANRDELKVGMIVAVSTYSKNYAGRMWGHVGIYVGDGMVMENIGRINTQSLDSWISYYGDTVTPRWGWAMGIDLSTR